MKHPALSMNMVLAATTVLAVILSSARATDDATVAATCKAAAASDVRVNLQLCLSRLGNATSSDVLGLAKVASDACISSSIIYRGDLVALTVELEAGNRELKPMVEPLSACNPASAHARDAFEEAKMEIKQRAYGAAMKKLDEGMSWTQKCNAGFQGTNMPEPLAQHTMENIQLAIIAKAITSLIK